MTLVEQCFHVIGHRGYRDFHGFSSSSDQPTGNANRSAFSTSAFYCQLHVFVILVLHFNEDDRRRHHHLG